MSQVQHHGDFSLSPVEINSSPIPRQTNLTPNSSASPTDPPAANAKRVTPPAAASANTSSGLNSRSCTTCRKRKVKCDKRHPCSNCNKAPMECVFPGPGRAPRRSRKPPDTELLARLRRLEGIVQSFGKGVDEEGETIIESADIKGEQPASTQRTGAEDIKPSSMPNCGVLRNFDPNKHYDTKKDDGQTNGMIKEFGRLKVEGGKSRYVSNRFWNSLSEEVAEMLDILDDPTEDEDDYPSPGSGSSASANHQGFIFSFSSTALSLRNFHPLPEQVPSYWSIFKANVDPLIKVLHIPYYGNMISQASQDLDHISKPTEVLMFTIYFAVVTSLSPDDCIYQLGIDRDSALRKYRFAVEQAFARTGFLGTQEVVVLQSMLLFLRCVRRSDDTRYCWTLTGLLIRLAQALGLHRDGQQFGLSPFDTEMRRRLWWQICTLDMCASEDHGTDPSINEQSYDTKFPLNINDVDIDPSMKEAPEEHEGTTEMTFDLIKYSFSTTVRRLSWAPPGPGPCRTMSAGLSLEDKEHMIEDLHQYLEKKYLCHCDMEKPLHWVAATVARLIMAKMWLVVHHPFSQPDAPAGLSQETKDRLFLTSVEVIEFSRLLETGRMTMKWSWLFRTYVQWHALAFVLSQLCIRTIGPEVDKAWLVIEAVFDDWGGSVSSNQRGMLWKPLRKLMAKARAERSNALEKQARFPLDGSLGPVSSTLGVPTGPMPTGEASIDFSTFDIQIPDAFPTDGTNNLQQPFMPIDQTQLNSASDTNDWTLDPSGFSQDRPIADENMNWTRWNDIVKSYQGTNEPTQVHGQGQSLTGGPAQDGNLMNWW